MNTILSPGQGTHVLKKKADTEIPPPFDLAVPILTDSGIHLCSIFEACGLHVASFWDSLTSSWPPRARPWALIWLHFHPLWHPFGLHGRVIGRGSRFCSFFHGFWLHLWLHFASILDPKSMLGPMQNRIDFLTEFLHRLGSFCKPFGT